MTTHTAPDGQLTGREYLRVSEDPNGDLQSPRRQHRQNLKAAAELGVTLTDPPYAEADAVSASEYSGTARGAFAQLLADLESGDFGAPVLWLYEPSRGSRQVPEWSALIAACRRAGVRIGVTTARAIYDPAIGSHRAILLGAAVKAAADSDETSVRIRDTAELVAEDGRAWGPAPYGYWHERTTAYDPELGRSASRAVRHVSEDEAPVVKELFGRLHRGDTLAAIARDYAARGILARARRDRRGGPVLARRPFTVQTLQAMALNPAYAGLRLHQPNVETGGRRVRVHKRGGRLDAATAAQWPAIVDPATFWEVRRMITARAHGKSSAHLLGHIARCGKCGEVMVATPARSERQARAYRCRRGCVRIAEPELDGFAEDVIMRVLADPHVYDRLSPAGDSQDAELDAVDAELARLRDRLAGYHAAAADMEPADYAAATRDVRAKIAAAERKRRQLSAPRTAALVEPGPDVALRWAAAPMSARRQVARLLFSDEVLGLLRVMPIGKAARNVPAHERVEVERDTPGR